MRRMALPSFLHGTSIDGHDGDEADQAEERRRVRVAPLVRHR